MYLSGKPVRFVRMRRVCYTTDRMGRMDDARLPCLALLLWGAGFLCASAQTLEYTERTGKETVVHTFSIEALSTGYSIEVLTVKEGSPEIVQEVRTDRVFDVESWTYRSEATETYVEAVRRGTEIVLQGRHKGKDVRRTFDVEGQAWYQLFPVGLERLVSAENEEFRFWAIGSEGIGAMRIGNFRARVGRLENVELGERSVNARHVHIALAGLGSILWSGDYWYRPSDGRSLLWISDRGPGTGRSVTELTAESSPRAASQ